MTYGTSLLKNKFKPLNWKIQFMFMTRRIIAMN